LIFDAQLVAQASSVGLSREISLNVRSAEFADMRCHGRPDPEGVRGDVSLPFILDRWAQKGTGPFSGVDCDYFRSPSFPRTQLEHEWAANCDRLDPTKLWHWLSCRTAASMDARRSAPERGVIA